MATGRKAIDAQSKPNMIEETLGFLPDEPFAQAAREFPSPDDVIEGGYLRATIFAGVRDRQSSGEEHWQPLELLPGTR